MFDTLSSIFIPFFLSSLLKEHFASKKQRDYTESRQLINTDNVNK